MGEAIETEVEGLPVLGIKITTDWVAAMQRANQEILAVREKLEAGDVETHRKFTMCNARVYKITKGRWRLYAPDELRYDIVSETHRVMQGLIKL